MQYEMIGGFAGPPCLNCECEQANTNDLFCSDECRAEYEGENE